MKCPICNADIDENRVDLGINPNEELGVYLSCSCGDDLFVPLDDIPTELWKRAA